MRKVLNLQKDNEKQKFITKIKIFYMKNERLFFQKWKDAAEKYREVLRCPHFKFLPLFFKVNLCKKILVTAAVAKKRFKAVFNSAIF